MNTFSRYPTAEFETLPEDIKPRVQKILDRIGFIPNVFLALGHRPQQLRAFFSYYEAVMDEESSITAAEKEMIIVATSASNSCTYCVVSHSAALRKISGDAYVADQLAIDYQKANITDKQKAMLDFACKLARSPESLQESDYQKLRDKKFSKEQIWDIGAITAFFSLSNRMAHLLDMRPNPQFYNLGRQIKK